MWWDSWILHNTFVEQLFYGSQNKYYVKRTNIYKTVCFFFVINFCFPLKICFYCRSTIKGVIISLLNDSMDMPRFVVIIGSIN